MIFLSLGMGVTPSHALTKKEIGNSMLKTQPSPVIFGCSGPVLTDEERAFFSIHQPTGFILFGRNIETPEQVKKLVADLKSLLHHDKVCILIDQEGGRVERLRPPHWPHRLSARELAQAKNPDQAVYDHYSAIAADLKALGITVNCAPVLDLNIDDAHQGVMGNRTFSKNPEIVARLGRIVIQAHLDQGLIPIFKHLPGHGAAQCDSHLEMPSIDLSLEELQSHCFPFKVNAISGVWGMTAHCLYTALDTKLPGTLSSKVIEFIRKSIGFTGPLLTDDICMRALTGSFADRAKLSLQAGCDIILHGSGNMEEMVDVMRGIR